MRESTETRLPAGAIEDDIANLIECMIEVGIASEGPTERQKQQFRNALAKFVDERIAAATQVRTAQPEYISRRQAADETGLELHHITRGVGRGIIAEGNEARSRVERNSVRDYARRLREKERAGRNP